MLRDLWISLGCGGTHRTHPDRKTQTRHLLQGSKPFQPLPPVFTDTGLRLCFYQFYDFKKGGGRISGFALCFLG